MDEAKASERVTPEARLRNMLRKRAWEALYVPRPAPTVFQDKQRFTNLYPFIAETIGVDMPVTFLEFGVWRGASIRRMAELFTSQDARFIGFDSFEGLPEAWGIRPAGTFSVEGNQPQIDDPRVSFVKGYFQNSLPGFLANHTHQPPVLVNLDADLYSSTLFLLTTLWHHIPDYWFVFDEFPKDEAAAMYDFTQAYPVDFEFIACTMPNDGKPLPQQLFGRMKRKPLVLV